MRSIHKLGGLWGLQILVEKQQETEIRDPNSLQVLGREGQEAWRGSSPLMLSWVSTQEKVVQSSSSQMMLPEPTASGTRW